MLFTFLANTPQAPPCCLFVVSSLDPPDSAPVGLPEPRGDRWGLHPLCLLLLETHVPPTPPGAAKKPFCSLSWFPVDY